ncbi:hypothetical protein MKEN_01142700 [Mycena kentingensis (nom. inval.)]|nr:hypothetical protein MKEN_01142700 [Mycena kentingensis (nom. inval.)]
MRPTIFILYLAAATSATSWFGSDDAPEYNSWSTTELRKWLGEHGVNVPESESFSQEHLKALVQANWNGATAWTQEQYTNAQAAFADVRDGVFDTWDDSRLREFLLSQGVVSPSGPREQLVLLAKQQYAAYTKAASTLSAQASTAIYGDKQYQMSKTMSSVAAQATREAARQMDDAKDYVYSTWEDNRLRNYLVEKGALARDAADKKRAELLAMMRDVYARATTPVWEAWSDSYMREWLVAHDIVAPGAPPSTTEKLRATMNQYYYDVNDGVWSTWSDSDIKAWLVKNGVVKSDAQIKRDKLVKLIEDNYANAQDTIWESWSDSAMREWLVHHGEETIPAKRAELIKLMQKKYDDVSGMTAAYLTWPDARLRAYLRNRGIDESALPTSRPGLLQETRIRWVQTTTTLEHIRDIINSGIGAAEDKLSSIFEILKGEGEKTKGQARKGKENLRNEL